MHSCILFFSSVDKSLNSPSKSTEQKLDHSNEIPIVSGAITNGNHPPDTHESTVSLITDEDFILADILERSAIDEENPSNFFVNK